METVFKEYGNMIIAIVGTIFVISLIGGMLWIGENSVQKLIENIILSC